MEPTCALRSGSSCYNENRAQPVERLDYMGLVELTTPFHIGFISQRVLSKFSNAGKVFS